MSTDGTDGTGDIASGGALLDGMRVLDAGMWRPVPHATQLLADLGATVLKIERPGGDPMRGFPEIFADVAAGKRSVVIDLKTDAGRAHALALSRDAHVFTEGWRPGVADRLGLGYHDVRSGNPSIIYGSLSGYGQTGPRRDVPGHDLNYQALAGAVATRSAGDIPRIPILPVADLAGATMLALVICAAWARRLHTGEGEYIDVSMTDVVASWRGGRSGTQVAGRDEPLRGTAGYGVFRCRDGRWLSLAVIAEDHLWAAVCDGLRLPSLRDIAYAQRLDQVEALNAAIAGAVAATDRDDAIASLQRAGAPVAAVLDAEEAIGTDGFPAVLAAHAVRARGVAPGVDEHQSSPWPDAN
ncbi:MAG: uctC [Actinomycetia bacterium]|nr:uctC [Actinomycetes bacterium]